jgi:ABC-type branched-subunit amino acid transport system ATPase component
MFGGVGTVWGPVLGAVVLVPLSELLHARLGDVFPGIQGVVYGVAIIAVILIAPEGIVWRWRDWRRRREAVALPPVAEAAVRVSKRPATVRVPRQAAETVLEVRGLSKAFGGLRALQDVTLSVASGEILGVIGPNGAGKTTFFNVMNGFLRPDVGSVVFEGRDVTGWSPHRLCAAGVGRTFQVVRPFRRMSVLENVLAGAFVRHPQMDAARGAAHEALERVGLARLATSPAGGLSNRDLRLLELARALAGGPRILLLDETLAGLAAGDVDDILDVVRSLAADGTTIVIIEHTMPAMVRLVDRFVVLDHGAVLVEGAPDEITTHPAVVDAYLGKKWRAGRAED